MESLKQLVVSNASVSRVGAVGGVIAAMAATRCVYRCLRPAVNSFHMKGVVAIVTGGSRGVGRGVCLELGRAGATVYVVGRGRAPNSTALPGQVLPDGSVLPGTIEETASEVTKLGGIGIPAACDCADDASMRALIERVASEQHGRLDVLVNCAILIRHDVRQRPPFWEQEIEVFDSYHTVGTRSTYVMSTLAVPLMLKWYHDQPTGQALHPLIVNVSSPGSTHYMFNVAYGVGKSGLDRIGHDMDVELRRFGDHAVRVVTLHPGMVATERMVAQKEAFRRRFYVDVSTAGESVNYTGRAVCALFRDETVAAELSGKTTTCTSLAHRLNFTDVDGRRPSDPYSVSFYVFQVAPAVLRSFFMSKAGGGSKKGAASSHEEEASAAKKASPSS
eukprot:CAMPEP_0176470188 /NCGR_PEP_ID=MMETSP0127-20121128/40306_1 /TAXON_ID=938130 /ORGANISM="Platyophrya macrostoma, Strain WH" /LENGTH=389 /DNA_ID=CAMNT_0017864433 /DNA_START=45 /DNA_END=1214 /DNA_ORIENTATION=-